MGWILVHNGTHQKLSLRPGKAQVGRAQTAQIRTAHQSVSRIHAEIVVEPRIGSLTEVIPLAISVVDLSSTGHTFINGKPSGGRGVAIPLADGDMLAFGVDPGTYSIRWRPLVLSYSSRVPVQEAQSLEALARAAGAFLTPEWTSNCTHLLMDLLAITPKLLCCIAHGGVPVAPSFLQALATSITGGHIPEPLEHRPQPPVGLDAAYAPQLTECLTNPRSRRNMLQGVWIIFGLKQAYDALSVALLTAGSQVHLLCTSEVQAAKVVEDLQRSLVMHGHPKEIWLVPGIEQQSVSVLTEPLRRLGVRCLIVTHKAVVGGILAGCLEAAHAEAQPFTRLSTDESSFPATQQQTDGAPAIKRRRSMPWTNGNCPDPSLNGAKTAVKEEDSLSRLQRPHADMQLERAPAVTLQTAQPTSLPAPLTSAPGQRTAVKEQQPASQTLGLVPEEKVHTVSLTRGRNNQTTPTMGQPKSEDYGRVPATHGRDSHGQPKDPKPEQGVHSMLLSLADPKPEDKPMVATLDRGKKGQSSLTASAPHKSENQQPAAAFGFTKVKEQPCLDMKPEEKFPIPFTLPSQTPVNSTVRPSAGFSQTKQEYAPAIAQATTEANHGPLLAEPKSESVQAPMSSQAKLEKQEPLPNGGVGASSNGQVAVEQPRLQRIIPEEHHEPVKHPTGVWLQSLVPQGPPQHSQPELEVPRAQCNQVASVLQPKRQAAAPNTPQAASHSCRNFKAFRKATGQLPRAREAVVNMVPWQEPMGLPLAEAFDSQPQALPAQLEQLEQQLEVDSQAIPQFAF
mmetsp:Transcript_71573/g.141990  ORF Transcript_71573/g.141990 Transcript_71573/m.141990 type:complete len:791 (-) Transcript_71573:61-2433(-)|eukprot:CAMPEP_0172671202 /NCGR_PEP_ID=MMETSP1074-20121228/10772_1 /TAXON_ID=2916 /ORGANISM="Ceratium fusus, Strain PA161109" /LENGTH=790 /DNA_ID=CAMNT_0013488215 /DNA_START=176 /DNA_END=2548 /DNA_ORIENTATION=+